MEFKDSEVKRIISVPLWHLEFVSGAEGDRARSIKIFMNDSGLQFKVFPFVVKCCQHVKQKAITGGIPGFVFSSVTTEPSRIKLYRRMCKQFGPAYEVFELMSRNDLYFYVIDKVYLASQRLESLSRRF
jgi:hypothetical protein